MARVLAMASGRSANRRAISAGDLTWRSELRSSRRPASASVTWLRTQVKTSSSSRCSGRHRRSRWWRRAGCPAARASTVAWLWRLFFALVVALEFGVEMRAAEDIEQALAGMAGDAEESAGEFGDLFEGGRAFAFFGAQLHAGDEAAEILIALAGFGEQRVGMAVGAGDFGADMGAQSGLFHRHVEARRAVDAVAVDDGHGGHVEFARRRRRVPRGQRRLRGRRKPERAWRSTPAAYAISGEVTGLAGIQCDAGHAGRAIHTENQPALCWGQTALSTRRINRALGQ
jgi:hypothetical protein